MSQSRLEKFKYALLKAVDISGFKVFDPVVRLLFGEEPGKQASDILKFLVTPILFVLLCFGLWSVIAPRHKTKSGEVPTPSQVWEAYIINDTLHQREDEKEADFLRSGEERLATVEAVQSKLKEKETESKQLKENLLAVEQAAKKETAKQLLPLQQQLDELEALHKKTQKLRESQIARLAIAASQGEASEAVLLAAIRTDNEAEDLEQEAESELKDQINEVRSNPPAFLKEAQLASNSVANEVQHLRKRLDYLQSGNRSVKAEEAEIATAKSLKKLEQAQTPAQVLGSANAVVRGEEKVERTLEQEYPRTATIWFQVERSLFTVFIGFVMAAAIAIPVGIMCGLNQVVMACLTPIISVFKPVSPVVWLLIFQIVVGAFFPDPENHPLFVFLDSLPWVGSLGINPALIFSACTVAMCAVWPAMVNTALGVSSVDKDHLNVAKVLRLGLWSRLTKIIIPSSLPLVFAGLRISLGVGWMVLIAAEALSSSDGLGKFVWDEYQNGSSHSFANIIFACFVVGLIGFMLDRVMILMQRSVSFDMDSATV